MADSYSKWVMTNAFASNSQAALNTGNKIEWVALKTSDDTHALNDLPGFNDTTLATAKIKQTSSINSVVINGNTVTITGLFNSAGNTADYYIKTIFLVAKYNGAEFLAGATVANTSGSAFRMPAASTTEITEFTARPQISVTNSSTISTTVDPVAAATNERVNSLETSLNSKIEDINTDKQKLWNKFADYVTKATAETISGVKTFTQTIVGSITGNAGTATKLQTPRKINGTNFDGTSDINVNAANDSNLVHKTGDETIGGNNIFTGTNTFTNRTVFDKAIYGKFESRVLPDGTDLYTLIESGLLYSVPTATKSLTIINKPSEVTTAFGVLSIDTAGYTKNSWAGTNLLLFEYSTGKMFTASLASDGAGVISASKKWTKIATDDSLLVHNTGAETIAGDKTFTGNTNFSGGLKGGQVNLPASGDLNTLTDTGKYYQTTYLNVSNWTNRPSNAPNLAFSVDVIGQANRSLATQVYYVHTTSRMWVRTMWLDGSIKTSPWAELANDSTVVHNTGTETIAGDKTFLKKIQGSITNADVADIRTNSISDNQDISKITTSGYYAGRNVNNAQGIPSANFNGKYFDLTVWVYGTNGFAFIVDDSDHMYFRKRQNSVWLDYKSMPIDESKIVHNSGDETIYDRKTFDAVTTFNNGIVNKPISMNGFKIDVSKLVSGTYNVWQGDISGCPADYGIVEVFENVSNTMYRFTQTDFSDVHVWIQLKNSGGFTGWKQQM